jgi:hypothetical protein
VVLSVAGQYSVGWYDELEFGKTEALCEHFPEGIEGNRNLSVRIAVFQPRTSAPEYDCRLLPYASLLGFMKFLIAPFLNKKSLFQVAICK